MSVFEHAGQLRGHRDHRISLADEFGFSSQPCGGMNFRSLEFDARQPFVSVVDPLHDPPRAVEDAGGRIDSRKDVTIVHVHDVRLQVHDCRGKCNLEVRDVRPSFSPNTWNRKSRQGMRRGQANSQPGPFQSHPSIFKSPPHRTGDSPDEVRTTLGPRSCM
jgi:hypothetical protein